MPEVVRLGKVKAFTSILPGVWRGSAESVKFIFSGC